MAEAPRRPSRAFGGDGASAVAGVPVVAAQPAMGTPVGPAPIGRPMAPPLQTTPGASASLGVPVSGPTYSDLRTVLGAQGRPTLPVYSAGSSLEDSQQAPPRPLAMHAPASSTLRGAPVGRLASRLSLRSRGQPCMPRATACCCGCSLPAGVQAIAVALLLTGAWSLLRELVRGPAEGLPMSYHFIAIALATLRASGAAVGFMGTLRASPSAVRLFFYTQLVGIALSYALIALSAAHARQLCEIERDGREDDDLQRGLLQAPGETPLSPLSPLPPSPPHLHDLLPFPPPAPLAPPSGPAPPGSADFDMDGCLHYMAASAAADLCLTTVALGYCAWVTWSLYSRALSGAYLGAPFLELRQILEAAVAGAAARREREGLAGVRGGGGGWGVTMNAGRAPPRQPIPMTTAVVGAGLASMATMEASNRRLSGHIGGGEGDTSLGPAAGPVRVVHVSDGDSMEGVPMAMAAPARAANGHAANGALPPV